MYGVFLCFRILNFERKGLQVHTNNMLLKVDILVNKLVSFSTNRPIVGVLLVLPYVMNCIETLQVKKDVICYDTLR